MKEATDYVAICCDVPMRDMDMWPVPVTLAKRSELASDGSYTINFGDEGEAYAHRFHCLVCNRYIGIAAHQAPRKK